MLFIEYSKKIIKPEVISNELMIIW